MAQSAFGAKARGCVILGAVLGLVVAGGVGTASAAPPGWSSPEDLSDDFEVGVLEGSALNHPDIDVGDDGDAVAVWRRQEQLPDLTYREDIWTRDRPLGGGWGAARLMGGGNGDASDPRVATNAGTTVVAWQSGTSVVARIRRTGGDYSAPKDFGGGAEVQVGVDASGAATVLWSGGGIDYGIRSARYVPGSGWSSTKTISFSPTAQTPDLAVADNGDAIAAWKAQDGVRVTEFTPAAGWTAHRLVAAGGLRPSVAANRSGQVVLAWAQPGPPETPLASTESVRATAGTIRGGLGPERQLSDDILWDLWLDEPIPEAAIGDGGDAVVAWNRAVSIFHDATIQVSARRVPDGPWEYAKSISVPLFVPRPAVAVHRDGTAIVVWRGGNAAIRSADQADISPQRWEAPFSLSSPRSDVYNPDVALDAAGRIHAVWADVGRPQTRYDDHLAFMAVQATAFGLPGASGVAPSPSAPVSAPSPTDAGGRSVPKTGGGLVAVKSREVLPRPRARTVLKRGGLFLKVDAMLPLRYSGRTLLIQRRVGKRVLRLGSVHVPRSGRVSKLIGLNIYSTRGATGVRDAVRLQLRIAIARDKRGGAVWSPFRTIGL